MSRENINNLIKQKLAERNKLGVTYKKVDQIVDVFEEKIKTKKEEIEFFIDKVIIADNSKELPLSVIRQIDNEILKEVDKVNQKLRDLKSAYQARITNGCRSDLFWRVTDIDVNPTFVSSTGKGGGSTILSNVTTTYTLKCVKINETSTYPKINLLPNPSIWSFDPVYFSAYSKYYDYQYTAFYLPYTPKGGGTPRYFIGAPKKLPDSVTYVTPSGIAKFTQGTSFSVSSDNLYGIKYYDIPASKDIGDTLVKSFSGTISAGSSIVTILEPITSNPSLGIQTGQNVICNKASVFPSGSVEIVSIGSTLGTIDPEDDSEQATASATVSATGTITSLNVTNPGGGYVFNGSASVTIQSPNARTAIGTAIVSSAGTIFAIDVIQPGTV